MFDGPTGSIQGFPPLPTSHPAGTVPQLCPRPCPGLTPDSALCNHFQGHSGSCWPCPVGGSWNWAQGLPLALLRLWELWLHCLSAPKGCHTHSPQSSASFLASPACPRSQILLWNGSTPGSFMREEAAADPWGLGGCTVGAAALGDTSGPFLSSCLPSVPQI